jgi:hypothetical protein
LFYEFSTISFGFPCESLILNHLPWLLGLVQKKLIGPKNTLSFWLWCSTTKSMSTWDTIIYGCKIFKWWILISYVIFQHN